MGWLRNFWNRTRLSRQLKSNSPIDWTLLRAVWSDARCLYRGPVGYAASIKLESAALERVGREHAISDELLYDALSDPAPYVAAYSFEALQLRNSPLLANLPETLLSRAEVINEQCGCAVITMPLGKYCRMFGAERDAAA